MVSQSEGKECDSMKAGFIGAGKAGCSLGRYLRDLRLKESAAADENSGAAKYAPGKSRRFLIMTDDITPPA